MTKNAMVMKKLIEYCQQMRTESGLDNTLDDATLKAIRTVASVVQKGRLDDKKLKKAINALEATLANTAGTVQKSVTEALNANILKYGIMATDITKKTVDMQFKEMNEFVQATGDRVQNASDRVFHNLHIALDTLKNSTESLDMVRSNPLYVLAVGVVSLAEKATIRTSFIDNISEKLDQLGAEKDAMITALTDAATKHQVYADKTIQAAKNRYDKAFNGVKMQYNKSVENAQANYTKALPTVNTTAANIAGNITDAAVNAQAAAEIVAKNALKDSLNKALMEYEKGAGPLQSSLTDAATRAIARLTTTLSNSVTSKISDRKQKVVINNLVNKIVDAAVGGGIKAIVTQLNETARAQAEDELGKTELAAEATKIKSKYDDHAKSETLTMRELTILMLAKKEHEHEKGQLIKYTQDHNRWMEHKTSWNTQHSGAEAGRESPKCPYIKPTQSTKKFDNFADLAGLEERFTRKQSEKQDALIKPDGPFAKLMENTNNTTVARLLSECLKKQGKEKIKKQKEQGTAINEGNIAPDFTLKLLEHIPHELWDKIQKKGQALTDRENDGPTLRSFKSCIDMISNTFKRLVGKGVSSQQVKLAANEFANFMDQQQEKGAENTPGTSTNKETPVHGTAQLAVVGKFTKQLALLRTGSNSKVSKGERTV